MINFKTLSKYLKFEKHIQVMVISEALCAFAFGMYFFLQILYLNSVNISSSDIGIIFSIGSLFSLLGFIVGPFINRFGRKNILSLGFLIIAFGIWLYTIFYKFFPLLISQIIINIGFCFIQVTEIQLLYSYTTIDNECCAYSYKSSVNLIFAALGTLVAGNINKINLFKNIGYKTLFYIAIVFILITFLIRKFMLPKDIKNVCKCEPVKKSLEKSIKYIKIDKQIRSFSIVLFIISIAFSSVGPYNNLILKEYFFLDNSSISIINFSITVFSTLGLIIMPIIIDKIGKGLFNGIMLIITIISCSLLALSLNKNVFIIILVIRCVFAMITSFTLDSTMMSNIELKYRDVFAGIKLLVNSISIALGNFIGGILLNKIGFKGNYFFGTIFLLLTMIFFFFKVRKCFKSNNATNKKNKKCCSLIEKHDKVKDKD
ncbi:MFS transporter [Clostridium tarantellae]|uniref:MFS transporter n=1 Tax=Clostridium tarantellae TaxID=39493 RepID=A0A6I1MQ24_9CLOT|nr:MFS transporter [Clostridium tarantellae]MPQ44913.1 MFS transporter [Clostridium tarantellae]